MSSRTIKYLPEIFRTEANDKFLNATLDQLVAEPALKKIYGYVGRKFSPVYKNSDNYLTELDTNRQNYQLEPSIVVRDKNNNVQVYANYVDLLDQIKHYGGIVTDQSRLFENEYYSFNGLVEFDKLTNFNNYYWLEQGPDSVSVYAGGVDPNQTFDITRDIRTGTYKFTGSLNHKNPIIYLARGGTYRFNVNQPGNPFWLQSEAGVNGLKRTASNISTRDVLGVANNGIDVGEIEFTVPLKDAQKFYTDMTLLKPDVHLATTAHFSDMQGHMLSKINRDAFDNAYYTREQLIGKTLIFVNRDTEDVYWTPNGTYDLSKYETNFGGDTIYAGSTYDPGVMIAADKRFNVWRIDFYFDTDTNEYTDVMVLVPATNKLDTNTGLFNLEYIVPTENPNGEAFKVFIKSGSVNANKEFYKAFDGFFHEVPLLTAALDQIYYQDGTGSSYVGFFKIVDPNDAAIDINNEILGKLSYTSPNGVVFTNGLKVVFEGNVTPAEYLNKEYYVERVGTGIRLVSVASLVIPESYDHTVQDYITINRSSIDMNAWSRNNRWFHSDVILASATYNNTVPLYQQEKRARRPIIEFEPDIALFNFGLVGKTPVNYFVNSTSWTLPATTTNAAGQTDAMSNTAQAEGVEVFSGITVDLDYATLYGHTVYQGERIIFPNDVDPAIRNNIYRIDFIDIDNVPATVYKQVHLVLTDDHIIEANHNVLAISGPNIGKNYHFNGSTWTESQEKLVENQMPFFNVYDDAGISFGDTTTYPASTFTGTKIFGYKVPTSGVNDTYLGFPLSYRNFNNVGDIEFRNYFDADTFGYTGTSSQRLNSGFLHQSLTLTTNTKRNVWATVNEPSRQYQTLSFVSDGVTTEFPIGVEIVNERSIPYLKVFQNNTFLIDSVDYTLVSSGSDSYIVLNTVQVSGDKIDVLVYSPEINDAAYYQVPLNLDFNAQNTNFEDITLGQVRNHVTALIQNSDPTQTSSIRDFDIKHQGGNILQHSAPASHAALFLIDPTLNYVQALDFASKEYTKFKNKFLELCLTASGIDPTDPVGGVDLLMGIINTVKNTSFPWNYSGMVPYASTSAPLSYTVFDPNNREFEITTIFDPTIVTNQAVLVYQNGIQLLYGYDYTFDQTKAAIIISSTTALFSDDIITIVEYTNTDGCFVPETPTKLGLYPKFKPALYTDSTYITSVTVIRGHDGSITPAFGDYRDSFLLELEKRIFNNIKVEYQDKTLNQYDVIPGKFRTTDYSLTEFNKILEQEFLSWAGANKIDYTTNSSFLSAHPFTWNYGLVKDKDGEMLSGSWRAVYKYYYDTETPQLTPWEMLGFSEQPDWWEGYYGPAPYTGANTLLWDDLETGFIAGGVRAGNDLRFARPGLSRVIPVDETGMLLDPQSAGLVTSAVVAQGSANWEVGQQGPVEIAWRRSSDFAFAMQLVLAITKPARYFGAFVDSEKYLYNAELAQYILSSNKQRIKQTDITFSGDTTSGTISYVANYLNWIAEHLVGMGIDPVKLLPVYLQNYQIQLSYKLAGFSDKSYLKILAEQSSPTSTNDSIVIPDENYEIYLNKSTPVSNLAYSAVVVEKTTRGYSVQGYDVSNPFFIVNTVLQGSGYSSIRVLDDAAAVYTNFSDTTVTIPYGYEFTSKQTLIDFLLGYEYNLKTQGFTFSDLDPTLGEIKDWRLSAKEFLFWTKQAWQTGNVIVLSPISNRLTLLSAYSTVDALEDSVAGTKILDQNFNVVKQNEYSVIRNDEKFVVELPEGKIICLAKLVLVQYEHALIFDNTTVFNDIIYKPELGNRQFRLKLVGQRTDNWTGRLSPPGFIYSLPTTTEWQPGTDYLKGDLVIHKKNYFTALQDLIATDIFDVAKWKALSPDKIKTGLLPNFAYNAGKSKNYYDVDGQLIDEQTNQYSKGLVGFRNRDYLNELSLSDQTQIKFYQGFIREKGTKNVVTALTNTKFNNITGDINYFEEWAIRTGVYGALDTNQFVEIILDDANVIANPSILQFVSSTVTTAIPGVLQFDDAATYKKSNLYNGNIALIRSDSSEYNDDILTAGYVQEGDAHATIFDMNNYEELSANVDIMGNIGSGYSIWAAKDLQQDWNVFRISETDNTVISVENILDGYLKVTTLSGHDVAIDDMIVIKGFHVLYDGFYKVTSIADSKHFVIFYTGKTSDLTTVTGSGLLFKLVSLRFDYATDLTNFVPRHNWKAGELVWIDNATIGSWGVYKKIEPWALATNGNTLVHTGVSNDKFGHSSTLSSDAKFLVVGAPGANKVQVYNRDNVANAFVSGNTIVTTDNASGFGRSLTQGTNFVAVGAPDSDTKKGNVYIYARSLGNLSLVQVINGAATGDEFGYSVSVSSDDNWLYIGAPGASNSSGNVYTYRKYANTFVTHTGGTITANTSGTAAGFRFGTSVKTNAVGELIAVGAIQPGASLAETAGAVYIYDRAVESFVGNGNVYITYTANLTANSHVTVNGTLITAPGNTYTLSGNALTFFSNSIPSTGALILAETSNISLLATLRATDSQSLSQFGSSVDICPSTSAIYIGAPGRDGAEYDSGSAYGFIDQGRQYGSVLGSVANATVTSGHSIRVNDFNVIFTGTTLASANTAINAANIIGVTSTISNYYLQINSDVAIETRRLKLAPGIGSAFADLGLGNTIIQSQRINPPTELANEKFGQHVKISDNMTTLLISSADATTFAPTIFDNSITYFDQGTTSLLDKINDSGAVFVFDLLTDPRATISSTDKFVFTQQLRVADMHAGDNFGASIDVVGNTIVVGASETDQQGNVFTFNNALNQAGWQQTKQEVEKVDPYSINKIFIYSNKSREIRGMLDWIDPIKGKVLGQAEQELDFKTNTDPAFYNRGFSENLNEDFHWNETQVGKTWWDLSNIRYVEYEQDSLDYRTTNWGKLFAGSAITIYEWVESDTPPSQYTGIGTPKFADNGAYVDLPKVDPTTGAIVSMYYFWVTGKDTVDTTLAGRRIPITRIQDIIENPKGQNIPYAAFIQNNSVALFNVINTLAADDIILHIDYDIVKNTNIIHSEYELLPEGGTNKIPETLALKLIDSLSGIDRLGDIVPDPTLKASEKYGIEIRPRQSMFIDRNLAVTETVSYVNTVFSENRIALTYDLSRMLAEEAIPRSGSSTSVTYVTMSNVGLGYFAANVAVTFSAPGGYGGTTALGTANVTPTGTIDFVTITNAGFGYSSAPTITFTGANTYAASGTTLTYSYNGVVSVIEELDYITTSGLANNHRVLVNIDTTNNSRWAIYKWNLSAWVLERVQSYKTSDFWTYTDWYAPGYDANTAITRTFATFNDMSKETLVAGDVVKITDAGNGYFELLLINSDLSTTDIGAGQGTIELASTLYGTVLNYSVELRNILEALYYDIFTGELSAEFNKLFFFLANYLLTEQKNLDWIFKTSFISVIHKLRKLDQYANFIRDNQNFYLDYINEVKPYRTKVREYLLDYEGTDTFSGDITDFDLPAYYDATMDKFRSPSGEDAGDAARILGVPYKNWSDNFTSGISDITIENPGTGFIYPEVPVVEITGGGGIGANARAIVNYGTGQLESVEMISNGSGYTSTATVTINGTGVNAKAYAQLGNNKTRKLATTLKFDRVSYTNNISVWSANTTYYAGNANIISYYDSVSNLRKAYVVKSNTSVTTGTRFDPTQFQDIAAISSWEANVNYVANTIISYRTPVRAISITSPNISFNKANNSIISGNTANINFNNLWIKHGSTIEVDYVGTAVTPNKGFYTVDYITANTIVVLDSTSAVANIANVTQVNTIQDAIAGPSVVMKSVRPAINTANVYFVNNNYLTGNTFTANNGSANLTMIGLATGDFSNANDRIMALYQPTSTMLTREISHLIAGIEYPGVVVNGTKFPLNVYSISSNVVSFIPDVNGYVSSVITIDNPGYGYSPTDAAVVFQANNLTPGSTARGAVNLFANGAVSSITLTFPGQGYTYSPKITLTGANTSPARATAYLAGVLHSSSVTFGNLANLHVANYTANNVPSTIMVINSPTDSGIYAIESVANSTHFNVGRSAAINSEVEGNTVSIYSWSHADASPEVDSALSSFFSNVGLGSNIGDFDTIGGSFIDTFSSHAPEELLAGSIFDHLNIETFTRTASGNVGYRTVENMRGGRTYSRISANHTTTLASNLSILDSAIYVTDVSKLLVPLDIQNVPGIVYINGERITYWEIDYVNSALRRIRRATEGTGGALVHAAGSKVVDASSRQLFPGTTFLAKIAGNTSLNINWEWANGSNISNVISFFAGNNTIHSNDTTKANLALYAGNIVVISGSKMNSNAFTVSSATSSNIILTSPALVSELAGNLIVINFYSNVNANVQSSGTVSSIFLNAEPSYAP